MTKRIAVFGLFGLVLFLAGCGTLLAPTPKTSIVAPIPLTPVDLSSFSMPEELPVPIEGDYI